MNVQLRRSWALSSGAVEALNWVALASMLVDHANRVFFGYASPWMLPVGRIAMPVFALVVAYNLARPGVRVERLLSRLVLFGGIGQASALAGSTFPPCGGWRGPAMRR